MDSQTGQNILRSMIEIFHEKERRRKSERSMHYTKHVICRNSVSPELFAETEATLVFDSYFDNDTCTDTKVYDCILETKILPKVCCDLVFSYLPNIVTVVCKLPKLSDREIGCGYESLPHEPLFSQILIIIDNHKYTFLHDLFMFSSQNHKYIKELRRIDYFHLALFVVDNVEYTNDYDVLLHNINNVLANMHDCQILDVHVFLKIICCMLFLRNVIPRFRKKKKRSCIIA